MGRLFLKEDMSPGKTPRSRKQDILEAFVFIVNLQSRNRTVLMVNGSNTR